MNAAERAARRAELRDEYRRRKAAELENHGELELAQEVLEGRCACGCGRPLEGAGVREFYRDQRHRQKAHRARLARAAEAAGVPARLSLHALEEGNRTRDRNGDAPARRPRRPTGPRPGVTVYLPSAKVAEDLASWLRALLESYPAAELELADVPAIVETALERRRRRA